MMDVIHFVRAFLRKTGWLLGHLLHRLSRLRRGLNFNLDTITPRISALAHMEFRVDSRATGEIAEPASKCRMVHLKTKEECRLGNETIQVWTVELPSKHAEGILRVIKENIEGHDAIDMQHLRRFAKPRFLPSHVLGQRNVIKEMYAIPHAWESTPLAVMQSPATTIWEYSTPARSRAQNKPPTLHLLICPVKVTALSTLRNLLMEHTPFCSSADSWAYPLDIREVTVPKLAPTSPEQAAIWSADYWPTFYRKTNPFGAHPGTIARAEDELHYPEEGNVGLEEAMALARHAGTETQIRGFGVGPGCMIVERVDNQTEIVAVAGDARQKFLPGASGADHMGSDCNGNVMGHAVMRAVGMIGRKRLRVASQPISSRAAKAERNFESCGLDHDEKARDGFFLDLPITPLEQQYFQKDNVKPDGYLCLRLEVFLTHEPCVMCSMALVHSRVGKVIFAHRMPQTGGLTAEMDSNDSGPVGLGYGLCWRKELNWQFMCWEYPESKAACSGGHLEIGNVDRDIARLNINNHGRVVGKTKADRPMPDDGNANVYSFTSTHV